MRERSFSAHFDPAQSRLAVSGVVDESSMEQLRESLASAAQGATYDLMVDLSDVDFLPSIALSEFIAMRRAMRDDGGNLALFARPGTVAHRVLQVTALLSDHDETVRRRDAARLAQSEDPDV